MPPLCPPPRDSKKDIEELKQRIKAQDQYIEQKLEELQKLKNLLANATDIPEPAYSLEEIERDRRDLERYRKSGKATKEALAIREAKLWQRREALEADFDGARSAYNALADKCQTLQTELARFATPQVLEVQKPCPKCAAVEDRHIETQLKRWMMGITHTLPAHLHELEKQRDFTKARAMRKWPELFEPHTPELPAPKSFTARWVDQD